MISLPDVYPSDIEQDIQAIRAYMRREMKRASISYQDVGDALGKQRPTVYRWLNGPSPLGMYEFLAICYAIGLNPTEVMGDTDPQHQR